MRVKTLVTFPVFPAPEHGANGRGGHDARYGARANATESTPLPMRVLTTARDALKFRLQNEPLPGPGSAAAFVAQQIGQLWIVPDVRSDHGHAVQAYERATHLPGRFAADGPAQRVTA